jgi:hypothetical protein
MLTSIQDHHCHFPTSLFEVISSLLVMASNESAQAATDLQTKNLTKPQEQNISRRVTTDGAKLRIDTKVPLATKPRAPSTTATVLSLLIATALSTSPSTATAEQFYGFDRQIGGQEKGTIGA